MGDHAVQALARTIADAPDPPGVPLVAPVASLLWPAPADRRAGQLRRRLIQLRPPRPLRFDGLLFHPLDLLVVPASRWRPGQHTIPATALVPMANHVRLKMAGAAAIEAEIAGRTTADVELIARLGRTLWPAASAILADTAVPDSWDETELGAARYRPLADAVAALLAEAVAVDTLHAEAATFMLRPAPQVIAAILDRVARTDRAALPMMIAVLLDRLPRAGVLLQTSHAEADAVHAAMDDAVELLLRQLDQVDHIERFIAAGSLEDAAKAVGRFASLLTHLETTKAARRRREQLAAARQRLDAGCSARFATGLQDEVLAPLDQVPVGAADLAALEAAARGLRMLETEGRVVGSGPIYDRLLGTASDAIRDGRMHERLSPADQRRLVEILVGPDAALAMLDQAR
jgi:hypothetical protein